VLAAGSTKDPRFAQRPEPGVARLLIRLPICSEAGGGSPGGKQVGANSPGGAPKGRSTPNGGTECGGDVGHGGPLCGAWRCRRGRRRGHGGELRRSSASAKTSPRNSAFNSCSRVWIMSKSCKANMREVNLTPRRSPCLILSTDAASCPLRGAWPSPRLTGRAPATVTTCSWRAIAAGARLKCQDS